MVTTRAQRELLLELIIFYEENQSFNQDDRTHLDAVQGLYAAVFHAAIKES